MKGKDLVILIIGVVLIVIGVIMVNIDIAEKSITIKEQQEEIDKLKADIEFKDSEITRYKMIGDEFEELFMNCVNNG